MSVQQTPPFVAQAKTRGFAIGSFDAEFRLEGSVIVEHVGRR